MSNIISYTTANFTNGLDTSQLHKEIVASAINVALIGVHTIDTTINIEFVSDIIGSNLTTLNGLVAAHVPLVLPTINLVDTITPRAASYKNTSYTRILTYTYNCKKTLSKIKIVSYSDADVTSYDVKVTDLTHKLIIVTKNLTNKVEQINDLGTLSNVPVTESLIEVAIKKTGGKTSSVVYTDSVSFQLI